MRPYRRRLRPVPSRRPCGATRRTSAGSSATGFATSSRAGRWSAWTRTRRRAEFRESFKAYYGPVLSVYRSLGDDAERVAAVDAALDELARIADLGRDGSLVMEWEYLLLTATRT